MTAREAFGRSATSVIAFTRRLRAATRDGERHYRDGARFRRDARGWSEEQRTEWMLRRLREAVRAAARDTPFYRERFRSAGFDPEADFGFDEFAALPVLERDDVANHLPDMQSPAVGAAQRRKDGTGGSSGVPLVYYSGPEERGWRLSGQDAFMEDIGVAPGASTAFLWGHHIDQRERTHWRERMRDAITNRRWYDCFRLSPELLLQYHEELSRYRPACLVAYASALDALATVLLEHGLRAGYPAQRLVTGGEKLWPAQRARIEQAFPVAVHERYGSRELGLVAGQLDPAQTLAMDVDWANLLVEPGGDDQGDGAGASILVTKLHADAMPMIRYRVGDRASFPSGSVPGRPVWRLHEVLGRQLDGLHLPNGGWVHGIGIPHLMKDLPVREFQIRQHADFTVDVLVVPGDGFSDAARSTILQVLGANLPGLVLRLDEVTAIPRTTANKWRPVITHAVAAAATDHQRSTES